jgi:hypothetical protein
MPDTPLQTETLHDTTEIEHFNRTWTVPTKRHASHLIRMEAELRAGSINGDLMALRTFLSPKDYTALLELDPDEAQLEAMADKLSKALGLKSSGNSSPSSASS